MLYDWSLFKYLKLQYRVRLEVCSPATLHAQCFDTRPTGVQGQGDATARNFFAEVFIYVIYRVPGESNFNSYTGYRGAILIIAIAK